MIGKSPGEEVRLSPPLGDVRPTGSKSLGHLKIVLVPCVSLHGQSG